MNTDNGKEQNVTLLDREAELEALRFAVTTREKDVCRREENLAKREELVSYREQKAAAKDFNLTKKQILVDSKLIEFEKKEKNRKSTSSSGIPKKRAWTTGPNLTDRPF